MDNAINQKTFLLPPVFPSGHSNSSSWFQPHTSIASMREWRNGYEIEQTRPSMVKREENSKDIGVIGSKDEEDGKRFCDDDKNCEDDRNTIKIENHDPLNGWNQKDENKGNKNVVEKNERGFDGGQSGMEEQQFYLDNMIVKSIKGHGLNGEGKVEERRRMSHRSNSFSSLSSYSSIDQPSHRSLKSWSKGRGDLVSKGGRSLWSSVYRRRNRRHPRAKCQLS